MRKQLFKVLAGQLKGASSAEVHFRFGNLKKIDKKRKKHRSIKPRNCNF